MQDAGAKGGVSLGPTRADLPIAGLILGIIVIASTLLVSGFSGSDDYRYLIAAERWTDEGLHTGADHWANRLPYVLSLVAAFQIFGTGDLALHVLHGVFFFILAFISWKLALLSFVDRQVAIFALLVVLATPLLLRFTTYFYPEVMEVMALAFTSLIVLGRQRWVGGRRTAMLLLAGIVGGLAVVIRQTAIAVPVSLAAVMFFMTPAESVPSRVRDIGLLAVGFTFPLVLEVLFYLVMTGDPLHRFAIDTAHVKIANRLKDKHTFDTDRVLFNWELAQHWERDALIDSPWYITPIVRLFASGGMLLVPVLGVVGGVLACRRGGAARRLAVFMVLVLVTQYLLNTFVIVLPPNTRYFGLGLVLLSMFAGLALISLLRPLLAVLAFTGLIALPGLVVMIVQPRYSKITDDLATLVALTNEPVYLPERVILQTALRARNDQRFAAGTRAGNPPIGAVVAKFGSVKAGTLAAQCPNGSSSIRLLFTNEPNTVIGRTFDGLGLSRILPERVRLLFKGESSRVSLYRKIC